ncbi:MAG TPA: AAA family ATPase, partial [Polyangium sp.]|nr:AAA family ATPase [Polyangium sp.]
SKPDASDMITDAAWTLRFEHNGHQYQWHAVVLDEQRVTDAHTRRTTYYGREFASSAQFKVEELKLDGQELAKQDGGVFRFKSKDLPKLNAKSSVLTLLSGEAEVERAGAGLRLVEEIDADALGGVANTDVTLLHELRPGMMTLDMIREVRLPLIFGAYTLQEVLPEKWNDVKEKFISIFDTVQDVRITRDEVSWGDAITARYVLRFRERSARDWIIGPEISAGMRRVLATILGIRLTPDDSVILIDELENSLGKNCLPAMVDLLLENAHRLQFIITSHHPYVINNIPISEWKLVQRRGSVVQIKNARDIPSLQRASHFEAFDRLMNLSDADTGLP